MTREPQWWGPIDETLHLFEGIAFPQGNPIRTSYVAACGWIPPRAVMEMPEDPPSSRLCISCRVAMPASGPSPESLTRRR